MTSDTTNAAGDYGYADNSCPGESTGWGSGANDEVHAFTPATSGKYVVTLDADSWDSNLYVVTDCANVNTSCIAANETFGVETVTIDATAGTTYYVIVDGYGNTTNQFGSYDLTIDNAPPPPANDTCAAAEVVGTLPFTANGSTANATADYSYGANACPPETTANGAGNDVTYVFTPTVSGKYDIMVDGGTGFDSVLYVTTDCADVNNSCLGGDDSTGSGGVEWVQIDAVAGTTYYIIVDGYSTSSGSFQLTVDAVPPPPANDTCATATVVSTLPFASSGDTTQATDDYGYASNTCPGNTGQAGNGSGDVVYAFTPAATASYTISVGGALDSTVYIVTDCAAINTTTCIAGVDDCLTSSCTEEITSTLTAGTTYYIVVDGYANTFNESGPYTIDIVQNP